jgi:hypothetical protein
LEETVVNRKASLNGRPQIFLFDSVGQRFAVKLQCRLKPYGHMMTHVLITGLSGEKKCFRANMLLLFVLFLSAVPVSAQPQLEIDDNDEPHLRCGSLGMSFGRVEGLSGNLAELAGTSDGIIILEGTLNEYLTPYTSTEYQLSLNLLNNFSILQGSYGRRWSTVPFPKVFLRPWVGLYVTANLLEDERDVVYQEYEEVDGLGIGSRFILEVKPDLCPGTGGESRYHFHFRPTGNRGVF